MAKVVIRPTQRKGLVFVTTENTGQAPTITLADGTTLTAVRAEAVGGKFANNEGNGTEYQWAFPNFKGYGQPVSVSYGGKTQTINLDPSTEWRTESQGVGGLDQAPNKALRGMGGMGGMYQPGMTGQFGVFPADLTGQFPNPFLIQPANYNFTDVKKFAEKWGNFSREEMVKNFNLGNDMALDQIKLDVKGMETFVPAAAALKRQETSVDNLYNQYERTNQVRSTIPDVEAGLKNQAQRAAILSTGRLPDEIQDRGFELTSRSNAADMAMAGGFGTSSSVARKASDLMSADRRFALSQYGDQLTTSNAQSQNQILMAPTSYSDAGQQVRVMPSLSASQLSSSNLSAINQVAALPVSTAIQNQIQQQQYKTNLEQQTNMVNQQYQNQFALDKFGYQAGYANSVAGAMQTDVNTNFALQQQQRAEEIAKQFASKAQDAQTIGDIASGLTSLISTIFGGKDSSAGSSILDSISNLFGSSSSSSSSGSSGLGVDIPNADMPSGDLSLPGDVPSTPEVSLPSTDSGVTFTPATKSGNPNVSSRSFTKASLPMQQADKITNNALRTAGFSKTAGPGMISAGYGDDGKPIFTKANLAKSNNPEVGKEQVTILGGFLNKLGVITDPEDQKTLSTIGEYAGNTAFLGSLTVAAQNKDLKTFSNLLVDKFQPRIAESKSLSDKQKIGLNAGVDAAQLMSMWDRMSPAQKSLSVASVGLQTYRFATGENLAAKPVIPATDKTPGMTVGQSLQLAGAGYNVYALTKNWDQLTGLQRATGAANTLGSIAELARDYKLLGVSTADNANAAVNVTQEALTRAGFSSVPEAGVGAIKGAANAKIPDGFVAVDKLEDGSVVALPEANASTYARIGQGALGAAQVISGIDQFRQGDKVGGGLNTVTGASNVAAAAGSQTAAGFVPGLNVATGAYTIAKGWGMGGTQGAINGAIGGSALAGGLMALDVVGGPVGAAIIAGAIVSNAVQVGKSGDQKDRDMVRSRFKDLGLSDKDGKITLSDGSIASIGIDGHGNIRDAKDSSKLTGDRKGSKLNAWDIDYTNDLDYTAGMGGVTLSRLLNGGAGKAVDQVGGNIGNAAIANIGYGKEMTQENFNKYAQNMRGIYAKAGITDKNVGFALANKAFAEGRINESELVASHQAMNMIYNKDGYITAQKLMAGRDKGIEAVKNGPSKEQDKKIVKTETSVAPRPTRQSNGKWRVSPGVYANSEEEALAMMQDNTAPQRQIIRTKEDIRASNARRYGQEVRAA